MRVQGSAVNSTTIQLQWQPPLFSDQNGVIRSYLINISVVETRATLQLTSQNTAINISGLHPHYTYTLTVAAVTIGPGPYGLMLTIRMPEDGMDLSSRFFFVHKDHCNFGSHSPVQFQAVHQYASKAMQLIQQPSNSSGNHLH